MNERKRSVEQFLDQSFERFRALPADGVELACYRVLQRLRMETDRTTEVVEFKPRPSRRYGRLVILIAATAATAVFAQQLATRRPTPTPLVREETTKRVSESVAVVQQPEPPKPPKSRPEFAATSLRLMPPGTMMPGVGLACHGTDGVQRIVSVVLPGLQDGVKAPLGRCIGNGIFLSTLIEFAYGVSPRQISGGPDWSRTIGSMLALGSRGAITSLGVNSRGGQFSWYSTESFQIEAVADDPAHTTLADLREMLRGVLANRFKLQFHREQKQLPGYSMMIAEGGSKMKAVSGDYVESVLVNQGRSTLDKLARNLGIWLGGPVIDKTGLSGAYEYAIEINPPPAPQILSNTRGGGASPDDVVKYVNSQMEEKLGLRLQIEKAVTVEAIVIDSVEPPSPN